MLDINTEHIRKELSSLRKAIIELHSQGKINLNEFNQLKKDSEKLKSQMGLREQYLNGYFGGDRDLVERMKTITFKLQQLREVLKEIDKNLKIQKDNLNVKIEEHLIKYSKFYQKLWFENNSHVNLYNSTVAFYDFLTNSKKKINDALLFMSWENSLNHPNANEAINSFQIKANEYQVEVNTYESNLKINLIGGIKLTNNVEFSTQSLAFESFNNLISLIKEILELIESKIKETNKLRNSLIDKARESILGS
jgi:hypothetical protein